ncbi:MAG: HK97 gp10 family phage protein [Oscillospiraceae bacterium]|nr:HK97 gp10 family phage protein [Oscillospiraceae bacterium]
MTVQQLIAKMKAIRNDSDRVVERGLLKAGEKTRSRAVILCPVETGELRNSIKAQKTAPLTVSVGTNKEYAIFVEYGTGTAGDPAVEHTSKESWRWQDEQGNWHTSHGSPPQPFLRPAVREQEIYDTVAQEIRRALDD